MVTKRIILEPSIDCPPLQGSGQGNGASGEAWEIISTVLLIMLREEGYGARFVSTISAELTGIVGFSFFSNTNLIHMDSYLLVLLVELSALMQQVLDLWESVLKCTGGALVPHK